MQGLVTCKLCGYAYYGKAISNKAAKGKPRDYAYYRCIGTDAYRFGAKECVATPKLGLIAWKRLSGRKYVSC